MQESKEPAPKTKPKRLRGLRFKGKWWIVQAQPFQCLTKQVKVGVICRINAAVHHRHGRPVARQGLSRPVSVMSNRISHLHIMKRFDIGDTVAYFSGRKAVFYYHLGLKDAYFFHLERTVCLHHVYLITHLNGTIEDTQVNNDAAIFIIYRIEDQGS